ASSEARIHRPLVLRVLLRDRLPEDLAEGDREALQALDRLWAHSVAPELPCASVNKHSASMEHVHCSTSESLVVGIRGPPPRARSRARSASPRAAAPSSRSASAGRSAAAATSRAAT